MALEYPINTQVRRDNSASIDEFVGSVRFTFYERGDSTSNRRVDAVYLHMPLQFENPLKVSWDSKPLGILGNSMAAAGTDYVNMASNYASSFKENALEMGARKVQESVQNAFSGQGVSGQDIAEYSTGKIVNPYMKMLFKGLDFRTFDMTFNFLPKNADEAKTIADIIKQFRMAALPATVNSTYMTYPMEVQITYLSSNGANKWLNKFKRCVITDLNVTYTGAGFYNAMNDGFPAQTLLKLTFTENELVSRADVDQGY